MRWLPDLIIDRWSRRPPTQVVGHPTPLFYRWYLLPKNRWFNVYLHRFVRDDDDRALHDHPWWNCSIVLRGGYQEVMVHGDQLVSRFRRPGSIVIRRARTRHRLFLTGTEFDDTHPIESWSLFIIGPKVREWGFHCLRGWIHWKDFCEPGDENATGPGCDGNVTVPVFTDDPGQMDRNFWQTGDTE